MSERAGRQRRRSGSAPGTGGGRYFIYRPPLGPRQPSDRARMTQILKDCTLTWSFSCLGSLDGMHRVHGASMARRRRRRCWMSPRRRSVSAGFWAPAATVPFSAVRKSSSVLVCSSIDFRQQGCSSIRAEARSTVKCLQ